MSENSPYPITRKVWNLQRHRECGNGDVIIDKCVRCGGPLTRHVYRGEMSLCFGCAYRDHNKPRGCIPCGEGGVGT